MMHKGFERVLVAVAFLFIASAYTYNIDTYYIYIVVSHLFWHLHSFRAVIPHRGGMSGAAWWGSPLGVGELWWGATMGAGGVYLGPDNVKYM